MENRGIKFNEEVFTYKKQKTAEEESKKRIQNQFDIFLDKSKLLDEIEGIFLENGEELGWNDIGEIERKWYKENGYTLINSPLQLIRRSLYQRNGKVNFEKIKSIIDNDNNIIFYEIKENLEVYKQRGWEFKLKDSQKKFIKTWSLESVEDFDCENSIIINEDDSFSYNQRNHSVFNTIMYFSDEISFNLPKEFLISCMKIYKFNSDSETDKDFEVYKKKINDEELFNKQIVDNLINSKMSPASTSRHITYALEHKLESTYLNIREYLKADYKLNFKVCDNLEKYIVLTSDYDFLIEFSNNPDDFYFWCGIKLLLDANKHLDYCKEGSLKYLDSGKENYQKKAIGVLFIQNDIQAINKIIESYANGKYLKISEADIEYYSSIEDFSVIKKLYGIAYNNLTDRFNAHEYIRFLRIYLFNISNNKESYKTVINILKEIKSKNKNDENHLFNINWLIDGVKNNYINSLSKPYTFKNALKKINKIHI